MICVDMNIFIERGTAGTKDGWMKLVRQARFKKEPDRDAIRARALKEYDKFIKESLEYDASRDRSNEYGRIRRVVPVAIYTC